jgi:hypothetical protein
MAVNIDNYLTLRDVDGLLSWTLAAALCCNTDEKINKLPEWHKDCTNITIWTYDAISSAKHRAEGEPCNLSRYIDGGMSDSVSNMLENARRQFWHFNKIYRKEKKYQSYKVVMEAFFVAGYLLYRYRHIEFLGPVLAKSTEEDDKATNDENYAWYKITQEGGAVGVIEKYKEIIKTGNTDDIKAALDRNHDLRCKQIMREVLSDDVEKYNEIDFPIAKGKSVKI